MDLLLMKFLQNGKCTNFANYSGKQTIRYFRIISDDQKLVCKLQEQSFYGTISSKVFSWNPTLIFQHVFTRNFSSRQRIWSRIHLDMAAARSAVLDDAYLCCDALAHGVCMAYNANLLSLRRL